MHENDQSFLVNFHLNNNNTTATTTQTKNIKI